MHLVIFPRVLVVLVICVVVSSCWLFLNCDFVCYVKSGLVVMITFNTLLIFYGSFLHPG